MAHLSVQPEGCNSPLECAFINPKEKVMAGFTLEYTFKDDAFMELDGQNVKFWIGSGLPTYEGDLDGFAELYPERIAYLVKRGVLRAK